MNSLECLEARIAPAAALFAYPDIDGDLVKVTASRAGTAIPPLDAIDFAFVGGGASGQLATLDLTDAGFDGAKIVFTVAKKFDSDGLAHVGFINAAGRDLDQVIVDGDLGRIVAGDNITANDPALNLLQVRTMGTLGLVTQGGTGNLETTITGKLGALKVADDFTDAHFFVTTPPGDGSDGQIGSIFIGGDLNGGTLLNSGRIQSLGAMGNVRIVGDVVGGPGNVSGGISSNSGMGNVLIGGDVIGGAGSESGSVESRNGMGQVQIGGDLVRGAGALSGSVNNSSGEVGSVRIGGDVSGQVRGGSTLGDVRITGDVTGSIDCFGGGAMGNVTIGGSLRGGVNGGTGLVQSLGTMGNVKIGGAVVGGASDGTGAVDANRGMGHVRIGGDLIGGSIGDSDSLSRSGLVRSSSGRIASVTIAGSLIAGTDASTGTLDLSGAIVAGEDLGPVKIGGSIFGNRENPVLITAEGQAVKPVTGFDIAIASLTVGGDVRFAKILAGFNLFETPVNADASIGAVKVGRDWAASSIVAGARDSGADGFGINDSLQTSGNTGLIAHIASIRIKGDATGSFAADDHFGFVAQQIDKLKIGARTFVLAPGPTSPADDVLIPYTADVRLLEV